MQQVTNTRIQIPPQCNPGEMHRVATVSGPKEGCEQVQKMIQRIITEQSSAGVMSGQPPSANHHHYPQQPQQPMEGQQGYTAEWAAYHAAQAAAAAAQQQLQQQQQQAPTYTAPVYQQQQPAGQHYQQHQAYANQQAASAPAPAPAGQAAPDTYYEQFFRYEYYYGTEAARQYYGAWAPPVGTPNPYGTNPNGIQPAPAATEAPGQPAATAQAAPAAAATPSSAMLATDARETSRRKVSNLPAWMTKK